WPTYQQLGNWPCPWEPLADRGCDGRGGPARDRHHGRGTDSKGVVRILNFDPHWETLRETHPVQIARHIRQADGAGPVFRNNRPPGSDDFAAEPVSAFELQIDLRGSSFLDVLELGLAEIGHHIPGPGVHQRKDACTGMSELS